MANTRFDNENYVCWLKVCMALLMVKEGLEKITNEWTKAFHKTLGITLCVDCTKDSLKRNLKCRNNVCQLWLQKIRFHIGKETPLEWSNVEDISHMSHTPWESIKLFLPYGCDKVNEAKEADIAAILALYINNVFFFHKIGGNDGLLEKVRDIRNTIMHPAKMEVELSEMKNYMATLVQLLQCPPNLSKNPDCQMAVDEITKLESATLEISTNKEDELRALNDRIKTAVTKADQANHLVTELKEDIEQHSKSDVKQTDIDNLNSQYSTLHTQMETSRSELETMKQSFLVCRGNDEIQGFDMDQITEQSSRINILLNETPKMKLDIDGLENRVKQCEARLDVQQQNIDSLNCTTQKHKSDITDLYSRSKIPKIDKEQCRKEILTHLLKAYKRNHKQIPIYPPRPSWKKPLDKIYVVQSMKTVDHCGTPNKKVLMIENDPELEEQSVTSIHDIFFSEEQDEMYENIIISGEAGCGKSTYCEHLVNIWYRSQTEKEQPAQEEGTQPECDEEFMRRYFSCLFFINLRDVTTDLDSDNSQITQMILKMYEFPESYMEIIDDLLAEPSTLVVFDALDESKLKCLPYRSLSHDCVIVTTTRPWKIETLRSEIEDKIERQIEIIGLEDSASSALASNVTQLLNEQFKKQKKSETFLQEMKDKCLAQFMKIPVLVMHMLCLWFDDKPFGNSQTEIYGKLIHNHVLSDIKTKQLSHSGSSCYGRFPLYCDKKGCQCSQYSDILWSLSQLAFDALLDDNRENSLVFDHDQTDIHNMSEEDIDICLKVGLLTQHMLYGNITDEQKALSFIHKTHQEYFAAVYLSYRCTDLRQILNDKVDSLDRALELEKVLMFVSGINPEKASLISEFLMEMISKDRRVVEYRLSCEWEIEWAPNEGLIRRIQSIILAAVEEAVKSKQDILMKIEDICIIGKNVYTPDNVDQILSCLSYIDLTSIKSIYIRKPGKDNIDKLWHYLENTSHYLQKLVLYKCFDNAERVLGTIQQNCRSLQTIQLCGTMSQRMLRTVLAVPSLQSLGMCSMKMNHEDIEEFCKYLSNSSHLKEIRILWLSCETHRNGEQCCYPIDLSNSKGLKRIELVNIRAKTVKAHFEDLSACDVGFLPTGVMVTFLKNLALANNLENFGCRQLKEDEEYNEYINTIQKLDNLQNIDIWLMDFGTRQDLKFTQSMKKLENVSIAGTKLTSSALRTMLDSLPEQSVRVRLGAVGSMDIVDDGSGDVLASIRCSPKVDKLISDNAKYHEVERQWKIESFVFDYRNGSHNI